MNVCIHFDIISTKLSLEQGRREKQRRNAEQIWSDVFEIKQPMGILILCANASGMLGALPGNIWWISWEFMDQDYPAEQHGWCCNVSYSLSGQDIEVDEVNSKKPFIHCHWLLGESLTTLMSL